jgi:hypothetical protein
MRVDRLGWPEDEVNLYLKSRKRSLSIHGEGDQIISLVDYKVVYEDTQDE